MWTHFFDMHSGGGKKEEWEHIFIELPKHEAKIYFYNRFGHNPERVTCTCCGEDYSISQYESLEKATGYYLGTGTLEDYLSKPNVLVIREADIDPEMCKGDVPEQGYIWV